jgi:hypothetical protein
MHRIRPVLASIALAASATVPLHALAADYHVSPAGDDAVSGMAATPWRTIDRVNRGAYGPGDRILFEGGTGFVGNLVLTGGPSRGDPANPITIGSYGPGRATIRAGRGTGARIEDLGGVVIRDLVVVGDSHDANDGFGILVVHRRADAARLIGIRIEDVEAHGFRWAGIYVGGMPTALPAFSEQETGRHGFADVQIRRCIARENTYYGIFVDGAAKGVGPDYANRDVAIVGCTAADNPGDPRYTANHSGNGILLGDTDGGLIDGCVAHDNGAANGGRTGGPVGIWAYASNRVTIQSCRSFRNRTGGQADGGGFDLDGGVTRSIIQYCYSHDNDGAGFLVWNYEGAPHRLADNSLRYNISVGDGRKHRYGGISVGTSDQPVHNLLVHNNSVYATRSPGADPSCVRVWNQPGDGLYFVNNLFVTDGVPAVLCEARGDQVRFAGNAYWAAQGKLEIRDGSLPRSLAEWRTATGQERWRGREAGIEADPLLSGFAGKRVNGAAAARLGPGAFVLLAGSPLIDAGLDLSELPGAGHRGRDFRGMPVPQGPRPDIGAFEYVSPRK